LDYCLEYVDPNTHPRALSAGAGEGNELKIMADAGFNPLGTTMNKFNIVAAREKYGVEMLLTDMHFIDVPDTSFDFVYSSHSFEHSMFPLLALVEWSRILRHGGYLFIEYPNVAAPQEQALRSFYHVCNLSVELMTKLASVCGFSLVDHTRFGYEHCPEWTMDRMMFVKSQRPCHNYYGILGIERPEGE